MLTVYRRQEDIPIGLQVIMDVETEFYRTRTDLTSDIFIQAILEIDGAKPLHGDILLSKFGTAMPFTYISTGCKCAILALTSSAVVNTTEAGDNAFEYILQHKTDGWLLQLGARPGTDVEPTQPILYGGVLCRDNYELSTEVIRNV